MFADFFFQDRADDLILGMKSTAIKFGDSTKYWLSGFATTMLSCLALTGYINEQTIPYYLGIGFVGFQTFDQVSFFEYNFLSRGI